MFPPEKSKQNPAKEEPHPYSHSNIGSPMNDKKNQINTNESRLNVDKLIDPSTDLNKLFEELHDSHHAWHHQAVANMKQRVRHIYKDKAFVVVRGSFLSDTMLKGDAQDIDIDIVLIGERPSMENFSSAVQDCLLKLQIIDSHEAASSSKLIRGKPGYQQTAKANKISKQVSMDVFVKFSVDGKVLTAYDEGLPTHEEPDSWEVGAPTELNPVERCAVVLIKGWMKVYCKQLKSYLLFGALYFLKQKGLWVAQGSDKTKKIADPGRVRELIRLLLAYVYVSAEIALDTYVDPYDLAAAMCENDKLRKRCETVLTDMQKSFGNLLDYEMNTIKAIQENAELPVES